MFISYAMGIGTGVRRHRYMTWLQQMRKAYHLASEMTWEGLLQTLELCAICSRNAQMTATSAMSGLARDANKMMTTTP